MTQDAALHAAILQAHGDGDGHALAALYQRAAKGAEIAGDIDQACFFLTQAYVFALEAGSPFAAILNRKLAEHGREPLQPDLD